MSIGLSESQLSFLSRAAHCRGEDGQLVFYAAVVLPIVLSLSVIAVDVSAWQSLREQAQAEADRIVLGAAQYLPDTERTRDFVQREMALLPQFSMEASNSEGPGLKITTSQIDLTLTASRNAVFDIFLRKQRNAILFPVSESSSAQVVPSDIVVIVPDSAAFRPAPYEIWGDAADWPAAGYFNFVNLLCTGAASITDSFGLASVCAGNLQEKYYAWATQNCFNPVYNPVKRAVIGYISAVAAVQTNRVAVGFSPGDDLRSGFSIVRSLEFAPHAPPIWSNWFDTNQFLSDESCIYFSHEESSPGTPYVFEEADLARQAEPNYSCEKFEPGFPGGVHFPQGHVQSCYLAHLSLPQAVYFHSARQSFHSPGALSLISAIASAGQQLAAAAPAREVRGNLAAAAHKKILVLTEVMPDPGSSEFQKAAADLKRQQISLLLIGYVHPLMQNAEGLLEEARRRAQILNGLNHPGISAMVLEQAEQLFAVMAERVPALDREVALKS